MPRVKRGKTHLKKRRKIMKAVKGYRQGRKNLIKAAKMAIVKAGNYAYRDRKVKKRQARTLWQTKISAALKPFEISYSKFMGLLIKKNIILDRKVLADLAMNNSKAFAKLVAKVKA
ncbi:MAG: 50S ribosomal protein L20 [Patescibacteria group bacterium]